MRMLDNKKKATVTNFDEIPINYSLGTDFICI